MREQFECAHDSKLVSVGIAAVWFAGGLGFWLASLAGIQFTERSGIALTFSAISILLVNAALRLPILCMRSTDAVNYDHATYLLTLGAMVNWFGAMAVNSRNLNDTLPAIILATFAEAWFLRKAFYNGRLPWLQELRNLFWAHTNVLEANLSSRSLEGSNAVKISDQTSCSAEDDVDLHENWDESVIHRTVAGTDPDGNAYVSGESLAVFEVGQTSTVIIVAFSPPLPKQPQIDMECEEDVDIQVLNCTPIGCRLEIKRRNKTTSQKLIVGWYATSTVGSSVSDNSVLP